MEISKEMQELLISSYFGDIGTYEKIREACMNRAFLDMARRIPYMHSTSQIAKMDKEKKKEYNDKKENLKKTVKNEMDGLIDSSDNVFDVIEAVYEIANTQDFNGLYKEGTEFYFGLAQKWVNMTYKYLWLFGECSIDKNKLDAPLDRYILKAITCGNDNKYGLNILSDSESKELTWSILEKNKYLEIQRRIKDALKKKAEWDFKSAIEWENVAWIEQAKIEEES